MVEIIVRLRNGELIQVPDFTADVDGGTIDLNPPEEMPRQVYVSPTHRFLFVEKHIDSTTNIGNVYRWHGRSARMIRVGGMRFDEAAVRYYCERANIPFAAVTGGGRDIYLIDWPDDHHAVFDVATANWGYQIGPGKRSLFFRAYFDLRRERFVHAHPVLRFR